MGTNGFKEILNRCGYQFAVHSCPYSIDVTDIFNDETKSETSDLLLDFLVFEKDFRRNFDKEIVDEVLQVLKSNAKTDKQGRMLVETIDEIIIVYKNTIVN